MEPTLTTPKRLRIYLASSWRNPQYAAVLAALRAAGHDVYNFKNPEAGNNGFRWSEIDGDWEKWTPEQYRKALEHPVAESGFAHDMRALSRCDALVMVQKCGVSSALELGWAAGAGIPTIALLAPSEPELMLKMADHICLSVEEVIEKLSAAVSPRRGLWRRFVCTKCLYRQDADGACQCAGNYSTCDEMRRPYSGPPCKCWACSQKRGADHV